MFFIILSIFLTEMCFRTDSVFPYKTRTTLSSAGQFRDIRKTAAMQSRSPGQSCFMSCPRSTAIASRLEATESLSSQMAGSLRTGPAVSIGPAQHKIHVHAQQTPFCVHWLPTGRPWRPFRTSFLACQNLVHQATKALQCDSRALITWHCRAVSTRHVCLSLWPSREAGLSSCSPWYSRCLVDTVSPPLILHRVTIAW